VAIALAALPIAILANAARVAGTGMASHWVGPEVAEGFFHTFSGWLMFVVAFVGLLAVQRLVARVRLGQLPPRPVSAEA
jgi:exosortase/archaeosortase family protein